MAKKGKFESYLVYGTQMKSSILLSNWDSNTKKAGLRTCFESIFSRSDSMQCIGTTPGKTTMPALNVLNA